MIDLTEKIKKKLKDEIAALEHELHSELPKEIKVARAHGTSPKTPSTSTPRSGSPTWPRASDNFTSVWPTFPC